MESLPARKLALIVEYDGTRFHGFQGQIGMPTIQGEIERALMRLTGEKVRTIGAGRTDAGVHAKGQVISFSTTSSLSLQTIVKALNFYLLPDISIKDGSIVENSFNARRDAISRQYRYTILNSPTPSPFWRRYSHFVPTKLNIDAMNKACQALLGKHNFASFTIPMKGKGTVRNVSQATASREGDLVRFDIVADSFLPKQVRRTVGPLIKIGLGKLTVEEFQEIIEARRPGLAAPPAPARGLCLMRVNYPEHKFREGQN